MTSKSFSLDMLRKKDDHRFDSLMLAPYPGPALRSRDLLNNSFSRRPISTATIDLRSKPIDTRRLFSSDMPQNGANKISDLVASSQPMPKLPSLSEMMPRLKTGTSPFEGINLMRSDNASLAALFKGAVSGGQKNPDFSSMFPTSTLMEEVIEKLSGNTPRRFLWFWPYNPGPKDGPGGPGGGGGGGVGCAVMRHIPQSTQVKIGMR